MKEATADLNLTLVIVIIIGAILAFFYSVVWPTVRKSIGDMTDCQRAVQCEKDDNNRDGLVRCVVYEKNNRGEYVLSTREEVTCTWKG